MAKNQKDQAEQAQPATERETAPATETPVPTPPPAVQWRMPADMELERVGNMTSGMTYSFPEVRGGICEYCGVIDGNYPSEYQYKLCPHYRGKQLACMYCSSEKDADDVINHAVLRVLQHPENPNRLIVYCDSYACKEKHRQRWQVSN